MEHQFALPPKQATTQIQTNSVDNVSNTAIDVSTFAHHGSTSHMSFTFRPRFAKSQDDMEVCENIATSNDFPSYSQQDTTSPSGCAGTGEDENTDTDDSASPPFFAPSKRYLRLPVEWYKHLRIHKAMFVLDLGGTVTIIWLSCLRHQYSNMSAKDLTERITKSFVDPDRDEPELEGASARHPTDSIQITNIVRDADSIILGPYNKPCQGKSLAWWLNPENQTEDIIADLDDFFLWAKYELDLYFAVESPAQSSLWVVHYPEAPDPSGTMIRSPNVDIQFNHRDGRAHHWRYLPLGVGFGYSSLDGGDKKAENNGDYPKGCLVHPDYEPLMEIKELDTPDIVYEGVCSLMYYFYSCQPDLKYPGQTKALTHLAKEYLANHGAVITTPDYAQAPEPTDITDKTEYRLAQVVFLIEWKLSLKRMCKILEVGHCSSSECSAPDKRCETTTHNLKQIQAAFAKSITMQAELFVLRVLAEGTLEIVADPNSRVQRMNMWALKINKDSLAQVFGVLYPGVDLPELLEIPEWYRYLEIVLARLADDLLLFQIAQGGDPWTGEDLYPEMPSGMLAPVAWNEEDVEPEGQFYHCVRGRDVGRHLEVSQEMPLPVHASVEGYLGHFTKAYLHTHELIDDIEILDENRRGEEAEEGEEGEDERCFSMECSMDIFSEISDEAHAKGNKQTKCT